MPVERRVIKRAITEVPQKGKYSHRDIGIIRWERIDGSKTRIYYRILRRRRIPAL